MECYDHLVAAVGDALPGHIPGDATNACAFLSLLISDLVLEQDRQDELPEMGLLWMSGGHLLRESTRSC